ncbi:MAG TPA: MarR family transcriptional regulator [Acidimicrobiales bacterium]
MLSLDPIAEARRQWDRRWEGGAVMAAATSIMRAQQIVLARVDEVLRPYELTFARYEALVLLSFSRRGALPMGKMGERLMIHPTSVTNIVDRLEDQGFVRRVPHETDGRSTLVSITDAGRQVMERATKEVIASSFGLEALDEAELDEMTRLVRTVRADVGDFAL